MQIIFGFKKGRKMHLLFPIQVDFEIRFVGVDHRTLDREGRGIEADGRQLLAGVAAVEDGHLDRRTQLHRKIGAVVE